ncbi:MAG: hypothetical protein BWY82_00041 [Verrucomicrobia bacterium ADurb.Bin474]|nr:MAG: hypothetical protein BWY82_00041 [Verrucomicrobia bacterium ADurb.Bin474]
MRPDRVDVKFKAQVIGDVIRAGNRVLRLTRPQMGKHTWCGFLPVGGGIRNLHSMVTHEAG